jgi:homoserine kinase type II
VRLTAILQAVARLHAAFAETEPPRPGFSLGLQHRLQQLRTINARQFILWRDAVEALPKGEVRAACGEILAQIPARYEAAERAVAQAALITVPLQPCVRDIWHDHLLLSGNSVTGIVDYGAMRVESRAGDLARLLGSLVRDDRDRWQLALQAYATLNPLRDPELQQLEAFDRANVVLSGVNWITWLAVERRDFPSMDPVLRRLAEICTRLKTR